MTTPIQLPALLFNGKASDEERVTPASLLACCTWVIFGIDPVTVKFMPLLTCPPTVTATFPVLAPAGSVGVILVELQMVVTASGLASFTVLCACGGPKL